MAEQRDPNVSESGSHFESKQSLQIYLARVLAKTFEFLDLGFEMLRTCLNLFHSAFESSGSLGAKRDVRVFSLAVSLISFKLCAQKVDFKTFVKAYTRVYFVGLSARNLSRSFMESRRSLCIL